MGKIIEQSNFEKYYSLLNPEQKEAVDAIEGPVLVIAGPGTGKTQTIAVRIAKILLETQVDPKNVLCLTFTETAAYAMRRRLIDIIGRAGYYVKIHTFHSFCNEIIQDNYDKFPELGSGADALTDVERVKILKEVIAEAEFDSPLKPFGNPEFYLGELSRVISHLKREGISPEELTTNVESQKEFFETNATKFLELKKLNYRKLSEDVLSNFVASLALPENNGESILKQFVELISTHINSLGTEGKVFTEIRKKIIALYTKNSEPINIAKLNELISLYTKYQIKLRENSKYDYEDMLIFAVSKLKSDAELLQKYQEQYQYILVDEYQDTNSIQNEALSVLGSYFEQPNIFVVGDDDQAIYRFQGASLENILFFHNQYKANVKTIVLKQNYRSQQTLLDASIDLIAHNENRLVNILPQVNKNLISQTQIPSRKIIRKTFQKEEEELFFIAEKVKKLVEVGTKVEEIAVLCRENKDLDNIREVFSAYKIPITLSKGENVLQEVYIIQLLNLFNYLLGDSSNQKLFQILNYDFWQIDSLVLFKLAKLAKEAKKDFSEQLFTDINLAKYDIHEADIEMIKNIFSKFISWKKLALNSQILLFFNSVIRESGYLEFILNHERKYELLNKLKRFYEEIKKLALSKNKYMLADLKQDLDLIGEYNLEIIAKPLAKGEEGVQVMTAHGAKGLEFQHVFIYKAVYSHWGSKRNIEKIALPLNLHKTLSSTDKNEDERRLFFVAMTRAKEYLYITNSELDLSEKEQTAALFVNELDNQFILKDETDDINFQQGLVNFFSNAGLEITIAGEKYIKKLLDNYQLSVTHISAYERCPHCFLLNNILLIPKLKDKTAAFGTAMHSVLRDLQISVSAEKEVISLPQILNSFGYYLENEDLSPEEYNDSLNHAQKILPHFYEHKLKAWNKNSIAEFDFRKHNVFYNDVPITGKIDRVDFLGENKKQVQVIDYKTGNPDNRGSKISVKGLGDYVMQLIFYKILIENSQYVNWKADSGVIEFVEFSKKNNEIKEFKLDITEELVKKVGEKIIDVYGKIRSLDFQHINNQDCYTPELHKIGFKI